MRSARSGGLIAGERGRERHDYSLVKRSEVEALLGGIPDVLPNWTAIFHVARVLSELESQAAGSTDRTLAVKTRKALDEIGPDLDQLEVGRPPSTVTGSALWPAAQAVGTATLRRWSTGQDSVSSAGLEPTTSRSVVRCRLGQTNPAARNVGSELLHRSMQSAASRRIQSGSFGMRLTSAEGHTREHPHVPT